MAPSSRPAWLVEVFDVLDRRAALLRAVVLAVVLVGVALAFLAPDLVPPRPLVGAAVAIAAILLGVAVTLAVDAGDGTVRGPRHVGAVGGELVGVLPTRITASATGDLADAVLDARDGRRVVLGVAAASEGTDVSAWTDALGVSLAARHASVLVVDLVGGATPNDGLVEVVFEGVSLGHAVTFERDVKLARLGAGRDLDRAVAAAGELPLRLPKDLEVLLLALPPVVGPDVINAVEALDAVLLIARSDATPRVQLQAAIEAVQTVDTTAQVVLIDDGLATTPRAIPRSAPRVAPDDVDEAGPRPTSDDVGAPRALDPGAAARTVTADVGAVIAAGADGPVADPGDRDREAPAEPEPQPEPVAQAEDRGSSAAVPVPDVSPDPDVTREVTTDRDVMREVTTDRDAAGEVEADGDATREVRTEPAASVGRRSITGRDVGATGEDRGDPWTRPRTTPREELERRPSPSVRLVRDLPPSVRSPRPGFADQGPTLPPAPSAASPRDPDLVAGAAAAGLAARLSGPATPPGAPVVEPEPEADPVLVHEPDPEPEPEPVVVPEPEPEPVVVPDPEPERASVVAETDGDVVDSTDEMPAVRDARLARSEPDDDAFHTTEQLATLMDELHGQDGQDGQDDEDDPSAP